MGNSNNKNSIKEGPNNLETVSAIKQLEQLNLAEQVGSLKTDVRQLTEQNEQLTETNERLEKDL